MASLNIKNICAAIKSGNLDILDTLTNEQINYIDKSGRTIMHFFAEQSYQGIIEKIIQMGCKTIDTPDNLGNTPMHIAVHFGNGHIIDELMACNSTTINAVGENGYTPMHIATIHNNLNLVKILHKYGASLDIPDNQGYIPLHHAAIANNCDLIRLLYQLCSAAARMHDHKGVLPLHKAIVNNKVGAVRLLLELDGLAPIHNYLGEYSPIHIAVNNGKIDIFNELIYYDHGLIEATTVSAGNTIAYVSSVNDNIDLFIKIVTIHPKLLDVFNNYGYLPIHYAARNGKIKHIEYILSVNSENINVASKRGHTPAHLAAMGGHIDIIKMFYKIDPDILCTDNKNDSIIGSAAIMGQDECIRELVAMGCTVNRPNEFSNPIFDAAYTGHEHTIDTLIELGADYNQITNIKRNGLHAAAFNNQPNMVKKLLALDINDIPDIYGDFPIHIAASKGYVDIVKLLINSNGINFANNKRFLPVHTAIVDGQIEVVRIFSEVQNIKNIRCGDELTCLHLAARLDNQDMLTMLVDMGCKVNAIDINNITPLYDAVYNNIYQNVITLILLGADQRKPNNRYIYPLHVALYNNNSNIAELLLKSDHQMKNIPDDVGNTPIHIAAKQGNATIVKILINYNVDMDALNNDSCTPLHLAAQHGHIEIVKILLGWGNNNNNIGYNICNIDYLNAGIGTPMHAAAANGHHIIVELLYRLGSTSIDILNKQSMSPMSIAAVNGHLDVIKTLFKLGASINTTKVMISYREDIWDHAVKTLINILGAFRSSDGFIHSNVANYRNISDTLYDVYFSDTLLDKLLICC